MKIGIPKEVGIEQVNFENKRVKLNFKKDTKDLCFRAQNLKRPDILELKSILKIYKSINKVN